MIKINENIGKFAPAHKNFPQLFAQDEKGQYYQVSDFYWDYDAEYNLIIKTTINDRLKLQHKIETTLKKRKELALEGIKNFQKELNAINKMLEGDKNNEEK